MQAVVLAGGTGTRLRPYTTVIPKPLMPVGDMPIIEIVLRQLKSGGFDRIILATGYLGSLFRAFFEDGRRLGLEIHYSLEDRPLGTAGPIALNLDRLDDDVLVMNGDLLTTLDYRAMFDYHKSQAAAATIGVYSREVKIDFGVIECADDQLSRYIEKPTFRYDVSMGVNVLNVPTIKRFLQKDRQFDLPELMTSLRDSRQKVMCYREECYWLDIGRIDDYQTANEIFERRRDEFLRP